MENSDIKYCVTSFTDLLGFSSHLEIGNDLRTNIGKGVINRLNILEESIKLFVEEEKKYSDFYPSKIEFKRLNDAVIFTMDLPEYLTPNVGEIIKQGISLTEIKKYFTDEELDTYETFEKAIHIKNTEAILELTQFIGLVSRVHSFINRKEAEGFFPGAKTVIASGFRKSFITQSQEEDSLSANFSFSNAYIAESKLKGKKLFIDNNILELLGKNQYSMNLLKLSAFLPENYQFDPFDDKEVSIETESKKYKKGEQQEVALFRKNYLFREVNPSKLAFIQLFPNLLPYLNGEKPLMIKEDGKYLFREIFNQFKNMINANEMIQGEKHIFGFRFDIEDDIESVKQLILTEESTILNAEKEKRMKDYSWLSTTHNNV